MKNSNHEAELIFKQIKSQELQFQYDVIGELEKKVNKIRDSKIREHEEKILELQNAGKGTRPKLIPEKSFDHSISLCHTSAYSDMQYVDETGRVELILEK